MTAPERFIVVCAQVVTVPSDHPSGYSFTTEYAWDGKTFDTRGGAVDHGFTLGRADDFNVAVLRDGRLVELWWMGRRIDESRADLASIAESVGAAA